MASKTKTKSNAQAKTKSKSSSSPKAKAAPRRAPRKLPTVDFDLGALGALSMGAASGQDERRRFPRIPRSVSARILAGRSGETSLEATLSTEDISLSGLFLHSTFFLKRGTPVTITLESEDGLSATVTGEVSRVRREGHDAGFAIHFDDADIGERGDLLCLLISEQVAAFIKAFAKGRRGVDEETVLDAVLAWELSKLRAAR